MLPALWLRNLGAPEGLHAASHEAHDIHFSTAVFIPRSQLQDPLLISFNWNRSIRRRATGWSTEFRFSKGALEIFISSQCPKLFPSPTYIRIFPYDGKVTCWFPSATDVLNSVTCNASIHIRLHGKVLRQRGNPLTYTTLIVPKSLNKYWIILQRKKYIKNILAIIIFSECFGNISDSNVNISFSKTNLNRQAEVVKTSP
jgi:hypothetical protein